MTVSFSVLCFHYIYLCLLQQLSATVLNILQGLQQQQQQDSKVVIDEKAVFRNLPHQQIRQFVQSSIVENVEELLAINKSDDEVMRDLFSLPAQIVKTMVAVFRHGIHELALRSVQPTAPGFSQHANQQQQLQQRNQHSIPAGSKDYRVESVVGIEESIQSQVLGIKGQVDLIAGSKLRAVHNHRPGQQQQSLATSNYGDVREFLLPLELKTGKWKQSTIVAHRAQVILYLLLMKLRQKSFNQGASSGQPSLLAVAESGLLLYVAKDEVKVDIIQPSWMEMRALIIARNKLAVQIGSTLISDADNRLPPVKRDTFDCSNCYSASECMMNFAAIDQGNADTSGVPALYDYVVRGLQARHMQYWKHWDKLIDLEAIASESEANRTKFNVSGEERSRRGDCCVTRLSLQQFSHVDTLGNAVLQISLQQRQPQCHQLSPCQQGPESEPNGMMCSPLSEIFVTGDRLVVSLERLPFHNSSNNTNKPAGRQSFSTTTELHANICSGSVLQVSMSSVTLNITQGRQYFLTLLKQLRLPVGGETTLPTAMITTQPSSRVDTASWQFRLDKDESNVNIATMRANLLELFVEPHLPSLYFNAQRRRPPQAPLQSPAGSTRQVSYAATSTNNNRNAQPSQANYATLSQFPAPTSTTLRRQESDNSSNGDDEDVNYDYLMQQLYQKQQQREHMRQLLVDLTVPHFDALPPPDKQYLLFCPPSMGQRAYQDALQLLKQYDFQFKQYDLRAAASANGQQSSQPKPLHIHKGEHGEFHLPGGLVIYPGCHPFELYKEFKTMNNNQQDAVRKILSARDFALLRGLPGTGKTNTLALVIRIMIARMETVLLTSYTHNAVDHLLAKLVEKGMKAPQLLRLGALSAIHREHQGLALNIAEYPGVKALQQRLAPVRLFACTVLNASRNILLRTMSNSNSNTSASSNSNNNSNGNSSNNSSTAGGTIDWCVMDEAGQMTQPAALGAITKAKRFVLVGDERQLPPLVISKEAQQRGMDVSLLKHLLDAHPQAASTLTIQYRMHADIMSLCNTLIYDNLMSCGSAEVAACQLSFRSDQLAQSIPLPASSASALGPSSGVRQDWLYLAMQPERAVVFLNTDHVIQRSPSLTASSSSSSGAYDVQIHRRQRSSDHGSTRLSTAMMPSSSSPSAARGPGGQNSGSGRNVADALIVQQLLVTLQGLFASSETGAHYQVAVITPFRAQVHLLRELLHQHPRLSAPGVAENIEISTVDKYQGKDKDVVIFCTVKHIDVASAAAAMESTSALHPQQQQQPDAIGFLLRDWRRINVALTRAKRKLIVVGSQRMMMAEGALLQRLAVLTQERYTQAFFIVRRSLSWLFFLLLVAFIVLQLYPLFKTL